MVEELQADVKLLTDIAKIQIELGIITPYEAYKMIYNKEPEHTDISDEYKSQAKETKPEDEPGLLNDLLNTPKNGNGKTKNISVTN
jgi:hypothetical protein